MNGLLEDENGWSLTAYVSEWIGETKSQWEVNEIVQEAVRLIRE